MAIKYSKREMWGCLLGGDHAELHQQARRSAREVGGGYKG